MSKWTVEYDNDVGPNDEGFWEWWEVTNGATTYKTDDKQAAERLCELLNKATPASTGAEQVACECLHCIRANDLQGDAGLPLSSSKMILCPECGNKRCPRSSDHTLACTDSNEPGQPGSMYVANPPAQDEAVRLLRDVLLQMERANAVCLSHIGMGVIDPNLIGKVRAALTQRGEADTARTDKGDEG